MDVPVSKEVQGISNLKTVSNALKNVLSACLPMRHVCALWLRRTEDGARSPRTGDTDSMCHASPGNRTLVLCKSSKGS